LNWVLVLINWINDIIFSRRLFKCRFERFTASWATSELSCWWSSGCYRHWSITNWRFKIAPERLIWLVHLRNLREISLMSLSEWNRGVIQTSTILRGLRL
jgi:hypothetical protein